MNDGPFLPSDTVDAIVIVMVRERRIDVVGNFKFRAQALEYGARWEGAVGASQRWQVITLPQTDVHNMLAYSAHNPFHTTAICAPSDLDHEQARAWATSVVVDKDGFPTGTTSRATEGGV